MTKRQEGDGSMWVATESFLTDVDGVQTMVHADHTRVRDGHPLLRTHQQFFRQIDAHFEVEQATKAPGEKRG